MKKTFSSLLAALVVLIAMLGCSNETPKSTQTSKTAQPPKPAQMPVPATPRLVPGQHEGIVVETINTAGYTYVQVDTESGKIWAAAPNFQVKMGDRVIVPPGAPMKDYHSQTLNRTFEMVYFVSSIKVDDTARTIGQIPQGHPELATSQSGVSIDFSAIEKPEGGKTVAELYSEKDALSGNEVTLRGKVVKVNSGIMGKNWLHVQDGTGNQGTNNLTVTADVMAKVGDTVVVSGVVVTDKDFGAGYNYDVIIEDAKVTIE